MAAERDAVALPSRSEARRNTLRRRSRMFHLLVALLAGLTCAYATYAGQKDPGDAVVVMNALAVASGSVVLAALVGVCVDTHLRMLVIYFVVLQLEILLLTIFGGICLIFTEDIEEVMNAKGIEFKSPNLLSNDNQDQGDDETSKTKRNLFILGSMSLVLALLLLRVMRIVSSLIGTMRALVTLLQTMNLTMLPVGLIVMASGFYIADSATGSTSSTDVAACVFVALGLLICSVTFIGCLSAATESRALLLLYCVFVFFIMNANLGCGIAAFVLTTEVEEWANKNWDTLRLSLPPTFDGRYDKAQFEAWVTQNMKGFGFAALVLGVYCASMLVAAYGLRHVFIAKHEERTAMNKERKERNKAARKKAAAGAAGGHQQQHALEAQRDSPSNQSATAMMQAFRGKTTTYFVDESSSGVSQEGGNRRVKPAAIKRQPSSLDKAKVLLKRQWTERWVQGSHKQRLKLKCAGVCLMIICILPIILGMTLLMYDSFCENLTGYERIYLGKTELDLTSSSNGLSISNEYSIGETRLSFESGPLDDAGGRRMRRVLQQGDDVSAGPTTVRVDGLVKAARENYANQAAMSSDMVGPMRSFSLAPAPRKILLDRDISCQVGRMDVVFSSDALLPTNGTVLAPLEVVGEQSVLAEFSPASATLAGGGAIRFDDVRLSSNSGDLRARYLNTGTKGASFRSDVGAVDVSSADAECDAGKRLNFQTDLGSIRFSDSTVKECDVYLRSNAGPMEVNGVKLSSNVGNSILSVVGDKGAVTLQGGVLADQVTVSSAAGSILCDDVVPSMDLKLSTTSGDIIVGATSALSQPRISGDTIQLETRTGNIFLALSIDDGWFGEYHLTSQDGTVTITQDAPEGSPDYVTYSQGNEASDVLGAVNCCASTSCEASVGGRNNSCAYGPSLTVSSISGNINVVITKT